VKKVLLLTYYWPPSGGPGVQRWLKNAVLLRDHGWDCIVITPKDPVASSTDPSLKEEVPSDLQVVYTNARDPFRAYAFLKGKKAKAVGTGGIGISHQTSPMQAAMNYIRANFFIPDARKGWNPYLIKAARKVLAENKIEAIISTGPPHSTHLAAYKLQKEFALPWLADFRDPWVNIFYNKHFPRTAATKRKDQNLENLVLAEADRILTVSPGLAEEFADRSKKVEILYNGYDPKDLPSPKDETNGKFSLSYTGNFKPNQNVQELWKALSELIEERPDFKAHLQVQFVGNIDPGVRQSIRDTGLEDFVLDHGYQAHHFATEVMVNSSALLFIVPQTTDNHLILTGKLFEYLGSGSPMLSIGPPEGNAAGIIRESERGSTIAYTNREGIKSRILDLFEKWQAHDGRPPKLDRNTSRNFTRQGGARKLAQILSELERT